MDDNSECTPGLQALEDIFNKFLLHIARFQGSSDIIEQHEDNFKKAVMSDPNITKEDIVDFVKHNAFSWSANARTAHEIWCREAD